MQRHPLTDHTRLPSPMDHTAHRCEVDVWSVRIDDDRDPGRWQGLLDNAEQERALRYRFRGDRARFVARRAFMRRVLAGYLGVTPAAVAIHTTAHGKPDLDPSSPITFNASHSDGLAVVAVARDRRVGVDVERVRSLDDVMSVAAANLTPAETDYVRSAPEGLTSRAFLEMWTRKESVVKAVGDGLSIPLQGFDTSTTDSDGIGQPAGLCADRPYAFLGLDTPDGYVGAVTVEGTHLSIRQMDIAQVAA